MQLTEMVLLSTHNMYFGKKNTFKSISPYKSNICVKEPLSKKDQKLLFKTNYCLMQVKSIAECTNRSILQYFQP